ncbi:MAG: hypothetical protein RJA07_2710 [Bacteroidota bacterium]|jgi:hypothetical protein
MRLLIFVVLIFISIISNAQPIGILKPINTFNIDIDDTIPHIDIKNWVGKKLLFLKIIDSKQMYDYVSFTGGDGFNGRPKYADCVDQTATVLSVKNDSLMPNEYIVKIKMNTKTGNVYYGRTYNGSLTRVVLEDDIDKAEKLLKGKIFWMKVDYMYIFNQRKERNEIKYGFRFKKVKANHFEIGYDDNALYLLTLTDEMGETGSVYVNVSNNNIDNTMYYSNLPSKFFYKKDPRKIYNWQENIWQAIEAREIYKGMTSEQAQLSWGDADYKTKTKDGTLKYKFNNGSYYLIKDGKVTDIKQ